MALAKAKLATLLQVKDLNRAIKFYTKTLGGKLLMRAEGEMKEMWAAVTIGKEEFWLIKPPGRQPKMPDLAFSTFIVKNIKTEVGELKKKGAKFEPAERKEGTKIDGPISYDSVGATAFLKDSEGNLLMLFQSS